MTVINRIITALLILDKTIKNSYELYFRIIRDEISTLII